MRIINKDKLLTIFLWIIIAVSAVSVVIYLIWSTFYKVDPKTLSVINYYNFPVQVSFLEYSENFEPFEVKTYTLTTKDDFSIVTEKQDSTELSNIKITGLKLPAQLVQVVLSETKDYCYFNANVTSVYTSQSDLITQVNVLSKTPLDYFIFGINPNYVNVYPGSSKPTEDQSKFGEIKGFYPIKCGLSSNAADIEKAVKVFSDYNHTEQINYYNLKKDQIQNTLNTDELNNI